MAAIAARQRRRCPVSEEIINIQSQAVQPPDHLKEFRGKQGFEDVKPEDLVLPRLAVAQDLTPQAKKTNANYIPGLEPGMLFNTATSQLYGNSVELIALKKSDSRVYFKDIKEGGGILCRSANGVDGGFFAKLCSECEFSRFGQKHVPPACTRFINFPVLLVPNMEALALSFKSTAIAAAQRWLTQLLYQANRFNLPMFASVWELNAKAVTRGANDYWGPALTFKRWASKEEVTYAARQFAALANRQVVVNDNGEVERDADIPF
jgi:hypothetical protein